MFEAKRIKERQGFKYPTGDNVYYTPKLSKKLMDKLNPIMSDQFGKALVNLITKNISGIGSLINNGGLNNAMNANIKNQNSMNLGDSNSKKEIAETKKVIYTDIDKSSEFPSALNIKHEFTKPDKTAFSYSDRSPTIQTASTTTYEGSGPFENLNKMSLKKNMNLMNQMADQGMKKMWEELKKVDPKAKGMGNFSFKAKDDQYNNVNGVNNLNLVDNLNIINNVNEIEEPKEEPPAKEPQKTSLTYIDVKHPKTKKIIDRNKGTITTIVDLG